MQIPAAYAATLAAVREVFPGAMIAGGALRDLDNDRPVKDLDIFAPDIADLEALRSRSSHLGLPGTLTGVMGGYENWATQECVGVLDIEGAYGPFQLIGLRTGQDTILPRLDFGICQIGSEDGKSYVSTAAYDSDKAAESFTLLRCDDEAQRDRSYRRFERLTAEKYAGWKLVDPKDPWATFEAAGFSTSTTLH